MTKNTKAKAIVIFSLCLLLLVSLSACGTGESHPLVGEWEWREYFGSRHEWEAETFIFRANGTGTFREEDDFGELYVWEFTWEVDGHTLIMIDIDDEDYYDYLVFRIVDDVLVFVDFPDMRYQRIG